MPGAANAAEDIVILEQKSAWNVDFAPNKCTLAGIFVDPDGNEHVLGFEQQEPSLRFHLSMAGAALKDFKSATKTGLSFRADQQPMERRLVVFPFKPGQRSIVAIYSRLDDSMENDDEVPTALLTEEAAGVEYVSLKQEGKEVRFKTGPLADAFEVVNACTRDMVSEWGFDADQHANATRRPIWKNRDYVVRRISDYFPATQLEAGESGFLQIRLNVDAQGEVTECFFNDLSAEESKNTSPCRVMSKSRFDPALDSEGKPFASYISTRIVYQTN